MDDVKGLFAMGFGLIVLAFALALIGWAAPLVIFLMKAGRREWILRVVPNNGLGGFFAMATMPGIPGYFGFLIFVVIASFAWQQFVILASGPIAHAYFSAYGGGVVREWAWSAWTTMLSREFWPFAVAVAITMATQAWLPVLRGSTIFLFLRVCALFLAALAFTVAIYFEDFSAQAITPLTFISRIASHLVEEILSSFALIWILLVGGNGSFNAWLTNEMVKMNGSLFRASSLYPKVFWVLILGTLLGSLSRSGASDSPVDG